MRISSTNRNETESHSCSLYSVSSAVVLHYLDVVVLCGVIEPSSSCDVSRLHHRSTPAIYDGGSWVAGDARGTDDASLASSGSTPGALDDDCFSALHDPAAAALQTAASDFDLVQTPNLPPQAN